MTDAQLKLANAGHAFSLILLRALLVKGDDRGFTPGSIESLAIASITRAKT